MSGIITLRLTAPEAARMLAKIAKTRVGLLGDFCLDVYWLADMRRSALSRETPHFPLPVVEERMTPGAGGNVAANLAALGCAPQVLSVLGPDWRGGLLRDALAAAGVDASGLMESPAWRTPAYCKPVRQGISAVSYEDPRIDFENHAPLPEEAESRLLEALDALSRRVDVLAVADQFAFGCVTPAVREKLKEIGERLPVVVDSRAEALGFRRVIVKPNEQEAEAALGHPLPPASDLAGLRASAAEIQALTGAPVILTLGAAGAFALSGEEAAFAPAVPRKPPLDIVGAGDTFLSAVAAALGAGYPLKAAIALGNAASAVTIAKCGTTGTATPGEILALLP